jgi:hypothetical protein
VAFVSDHVETLGEINHEAREEAHRLGITHFEMTAGLNDSQKFISALAQLVWEALDDGVDSRNSGHANGRQMAVPELMAASGD